MHDDLKKQELYTNKLLVIREVLFCSSVFVMLCFVNCKKKRARLFKEVVRMVERVDGGRSNLMGPGCK